MLPAAAPSPPPASVADAARTVEVPVPQLAGSRAGLEVVARALSDVVAPELDRERDAPLPLGSPRKVMAEIEDALGAAAVPVEGIGEHPALRRIAGVLGGLGVDLTHPHAAAHLQPPPLAVAVAADALASASNASLDTYDSGPSAIGIERWVLRSLSRLAGLGENTAGVLTPGGSLSNLMALLLARDAAAHRRGGDIRRDGLGALPEPVVFCSELAHFSVNRAAAVLGLGERAVRSVPVDTRHRIRADVLATMLAELRPQQTALAVIATAGTTDYGSIDPLPQIAELAGEAGLWLHVDAAYGFGACFSDRLSPKLAGLELADSIALDLHKIGWQPASASALLVADPSAFAVLDHEVAYLNPVDDVEAGYGGLLGRSLQTTRRPDAVKVAVTLLAHGSRGLGRLVDACHALARHAETRVRAEPELELVSGAELTTVVFRFVPRDGLGGAAAAAVDAINAELRRRLIASGDALVGRTTTAAAGTAGATGARVCLKLTLLNPTASAANVDALFDLVLTTGKDCAAGRQTR